MMKCFKSPAPHVVLQLKNVYICSLWWWVKQSFLFLLPKMSRYQRPRGCYPSPPQKTRPYWDVIHHDLHSVVNGLYL